MGTWIAPMRDFRHNRTIVVPQQRGDSSQGAVKFPTGGNGASAHGAKSF